MVDETGLVERVARAIAIPQHHTGYDRLSEAEKDLYMMQAEYACKEINDALEAAAFLCARVRELECTFGDADEMIRDYFGHVLPALARMDTALQNGASNGR